MTLSPTTYTVHLVVTHCFDCANFYASGDPFKVGIVALSVLCIPFRTTESVDLRCFIGLRAALPSRLTSVVCERLWELSNAHGSRIQVNPTQATDAPELQAASSNLALALCKLIKF